ncbi:MAG: site-specific integrase [Treponema sp.]|jgi:integrase|nr:site-specific integrase [Treponema sp.]
MKIHNDFTLYWRVVPSGKRVVYYYAYDTDGNRLGGWSTGEATMTAARVACNRLLREGKLIPHSGSMPTFAEYAQGWWEWETCAYLKKRRKRRNLTQTYADNNKKNLKNQLVPYFGDMPLNKITKDDVENWFDKLTDEDYQNTTINGYFGALKTMLIEAAARKIIAVTPTEKVEKLVNDRREIKIITSQEFKKLFVGDWERVWDDRYTQRSLSAPALRLPSCLSGRPACWPCKKSGHIYLCKQFDEYGYRDTKTKDKHNILLAREMINDLQELKHMNGDGFVFSLDGGATPVCRMTIYKDFHRALRNIGLSDDEISERRLHLHAWRHFFNTELLKGGLTIPQAQAVTGHKSDRMTEWYTHFDPTEFVQAKQVQESLLSPEGLKPKKAVTNATPKEGRTGEAGAKKILPFSGRKRNSK